MVHDGGNDGVVPQLLDGGRDGLGENERRCVFYPILIDGLRIRLGKGVSANRE